MNLLIFLIFGGLVCKIRITIFTLGPVGNVVVKALDPTCLIPGFESWIWQLGRHAKHMCVIA